MKRTQVANNPKSVVIFIPGFKGSYLKDRNNKDIIWINGYQALFGRDTLNLFETDLESAGVIKDISIIPFFYSNDIYGDFLDTLQAQLNDDKNLILFDYDWRKDNFENVIKLSKLIKKLKSQGVEKINIIAHSMGGLIAAYYLRYGEESPEHAEENWIGAKEINSLVLIGTPFDGSVQIFSDFIKGAKSIFNDQLLSAEATQSFGSSYQLLPFTSANILDEELRDTGENFFIDNIWDKYQIVSYYDKKIRNNYLNKAKNFLAKIKAESKEKQKFNSKILFIQGRGFKTITRVICRIDKKPNCLFPKEVDLNISNKDLLFEEGDGIVNIFSAQLPNAFKDNFQSLTLEVNGEHLEMINDKLVRTQILKFIN